MHYLCDESHVLRCTYVGFQHQVENQQNRRTDAERNFTCRPGATQRIPWELFKPHHVRCACTRNLPLARARAQESKTNAFTRGVAAARGAGRGAAPRSQPHTSNQGRDGPRDLPPRSPLISHLLSPCVRCTCDGAGLDAPPPLVRSYQLETHSEESNTPGWGSEAPARRAGGRAPAATLAAGQDERIFEFI
jgi:hypothetical protein